MKLLTTVMGAVATLVVVGLAVQGKLIDPSTMGSALSVDPAQDETHLLTSRVKAKILCGFDEVAASPSGKFSVFLKMDYSDPPARQTTPGLMIVNNACLTSGATFQDCAKFATGSTGLEFVTWGTNDTVIARTRSNLVSLHATGEPLEIARVEAAQIPRNTPQLIAGPSTELTIAQLANAITAERSESSRPKVGSGGMRIAALLLNDHPKIKRLLFSPFDLSLYVDGSQGAVTPLGFSLPYSGKIELAQGPTLAPSRRSDKTIEIGSRNSGLKVAQVGMPDLSSGPYYLLDIESRGRFLSTIKENFRGGRIYEIAGPEGSISQRCGEDAVGMRRILTDFGSPGRPMPVVQLQHAEEKRPIAVIFIGGPASEPFRDSDRPAVKTFVDSGYDVWLAGYSGSAVLPQSVALRLMKRGLPSLVHDGTLIARIARQAEDRGRRIVIYGESFGAIPALSMARELRRADLVLVAPLLKRKDADQTVAGLSNPGFGTITASSQRAFERGTIGDVGDLAKSNALLWDLQKGLQDRRVHVAFASPDPLSGTSDLRYVTQHRVYPVTHGALGSVAAVWRDIHEFLSQPDARVRPKGRQ